MDEEGHTHKVYVLLLHIDIIIRVYMKNFYIEFL